MKSDKYIQFHFSDGAGQCARYFIQDGAGTLQHPNQYTDCYETNLSHNERFTLIRLAYGQVPYPLCLAALDISPWQGESAFPREGEGSNIGTYWTAQ